MKINRTEELSIFAKVHLLTERSQNAGFVTLTFALRRILNDKVERIVPSTLTSESSKYLFPQKLKFNSREQEREVKYVSGHAHGH